MTVLLLVFGASDARAGEETPYELARAIEIGDKARVRALLDAGTPLSAPNAQAWPPTAIACSMLVDEPDGTPQGRQWEDILKLLLARGADPNAADELGTTALHVGGNDPRCVVPLLAAGANPGLLSAFDKSDISPIPPRVTPIETSITDANSMARVEGIRLLIAGGADPKRLTHDSLTLKRIVADRLAEQMEIVETYPPFDAIWPGDGWWRSKLALYELLDAHGVVDADADSAFAGLRRTAIDRYGSGKSSKPADAADWWTIATGNIVSVIGTSVDGDVTFDGGCNRLLPPGFFGTILRYRGDKLERNDAGSQGAVFDIVDARGATASFPAKLHYHLPDRAWVLSDPLPTTFFDAFARGRSMSVRNDAGETVVTFGLRGSARAVEGMRLVCRFTPR